MNRKKLNPMQGQKNSKGITQNAETMGYHACLASCTQAEFSGVTRVHIFSLQVWADLVHIGHFDSVSGGSAFVFHSHMVQYSFMGQS